MNTVLFRLFNMSLTAVWMILAVVIMRLVFKNAPKSLRCFMWMLVALRLICPFSIESAISLIPFHDSATNYDVPITVKQTEPVMQYVDENGFEITIEDEESQEIGEVSLYNPVGEQVIANKTKFVKVFNIIWFIGVVSIFAYSIISYVRLRNRVKTSAYVWDRIWISDEVETPFILGIKNPRIYLPSAMDEETGNQVIAHEQAHFKRKDYIWKPLGFVIASVYWFNPLVWLAYVLFCRDIELACDEKVIKSLDSDEKKLYSKALVSCSVPHRVISACPMAFGELRVKERVKEILVYKKPAVWLVVLAVITIAATGACYLTNPEEVLVYDEDTYAVGNNGVVTLDEFDIAYNAFLEARYTEKAAEKRASEYCFEQEALYQQALKQGYSTDNDEVTVYVEGIKESFLVDENGKTKYEENIKKYGSEEAYFDILKIYSEKEIIKTKYIDALDISDERKLNRLLSAFSDEENFDIIEVNLKRYKENNTPATYKKERSNINFNINYFKVNNSMPEYIAYVYYDEVTPNVSKQVIIKEKDAYKVVQRINLVENDRFDDEFIYFADINFDGNMDIVIPRISNVNSRYFAVYLYNTENNQFVYNESFNEIRNFVLDTENECILSSNSGNGATTYYIYQFNDKTQEMALAHSLYIGRDFKNPEYYPEVRILEKKYDENNMEEVVNDINVDSAIIRDAYYGNFKGSAVSQYYEEGSLWDLNNAIWGNEFSY